MTRRMGMQRTQRRLAMAKRGRKPTAEKKAAEQLEDLYRQQQVPAQCLISDLQIPCLSVLNRQIMWCDQALEQQHSTPGKRRRSKAVETPQEPIDGDEAAEAAAAEADAYSEDEDEESDFEL